MQTYRQRIIELLSEKEMTARDLSRALGIREKEVYRHLEHVEKSVARTGRKLVVKSFQCLSCGYSFRDRTRYTPPGRCPRCKSSYLEKPFYRISA